MQQNTQAKLLKWDTTIDYVDILRCFAADEEWLSRLSIAQHLGVTKSPHLIRKLTDLVQGGFLELQLVGLPNKVDMYAYALSEEGLIARNLGGMPAGWLAAL